MAPQMRERRLEVWAVAALSAGAAIMHMQGAQGAQAVSHESHRRVPFSGRDELRSGEDAGGVVKYPAESNGLPVVNVGALRSAMALGTNGSTLRIASTAAVKRALLDYGLLYIANTGMDVDRRAAALQGATQAVFNAPPETTAGLVDSSLFPPRGLTPFESESVARVLGIGNYSDHVAKYSMGNTPRNPNIWPEGDTGFQKAWETYHDEAIDVARDLLFLIARVLDLEDAAVWRPVLADTGESILRHLRYPDVAPHRTSDATANHRMPAHHDLDLITLIHQTPAQNGFVSLQGQFGDPPEWVDVPAVPDTMVVTCGEVLTVITGSQVTPAIHRVAAPSETLRIGSERSVTAMFYQPHGHVKIRPPDNTHFGVQPFPKEGLAFSEWQRFAFRNFRQG
mmetsp:Transcript_10596/g.27235  ORF Transcript_10596/g.27235 Transcript_10596/m.27235 type:complete len:396 (+) Transcript_10596:186-1373(+)